MEDGEEVGGGWREKGQEGEEEKEKMKTEREEES